MMLKARFLGALAVAAGLSATLAMAHSGVKNMTVMKRMEAMKSIGENTKVLGQMAKGERGFNAEAARAAAAAIAQHAAQTPALFEAEESDPMDEAKPLIWERFEDFSEKSDALENVALKLADTLETEADLRAGLGQIGATCKACHEVYRE